MSKRHAMIRCPSADLYPMIDNATLMSFEILDKVLDSKDGKTIWECLKVH